MRRQAGTQALLVLAALASALVCADSPTAAPGGSSGAATAQISASDADEINVLVAFHDVITAADRALLASLAQREPTYEFHTFPALVVPVPPRIVGSVLAMLRASARVRYASPGLEVLMPQAETSSAAVTSDRHRRGGVTIQICSPDDPDCEPPPPPPPSTTETVGWHFNLYSFGESIANAIATYGQPNGSGVGVAIIANGINCVNQPDFIQPCAGGVDFSGAGDPFYDPVGGTTGMASLLLAEANNSFGIRGIAPRVSLYAVKIANNCLSAAQAFDYINYNLPDVSIIITGHYRTAQTLADQQAYEAQCAGERDAVLSATAAGLLIVSGAGITAASDDSVTYPARLPGVAAVGGFGCASFSGGSICNSGPRYAPLSARGRQVAFAAAFEHLPVLYPGSGTPQVLDGPWYAAATAGGIAALVHERYNLSRKGQCVLERVTVVGGCRGAGRAWRGRGA